MSSPGFQKLPEGQRNAIRKKLGVPLLPVQRAVEPGAGSSPVASRGVDAPRGGGRPLEASTRQHMERRLGHDFRQVRVFTDTRAAESARSLHARAYTRGTDIVFAAQRYAPGTESGRRLLAHELTHVKQQATGSGPERSGTLAPGQDALELEAEALSKRGV